MIALAPQAQIPLEQVFFSSAVGFGLLFTVNLGFSRLHIRDHHKSKRIFQPRIGLLSTLEFCSHAFLEGLAIGVSFQLQFGLGVFVAVAVVSHDFCDGISTLALMLNSGNTLRSSIGMLFVDALAPVIGAVTSLFFAVEGYILVYVLSFLLGSFLFIGFGTLLPDAYRMNRPKETAIFFIAGFSLIFLLAQIIG